MSEASEVRRNRERRLNRAGRGSPLQGRPLITAVVFVAVGVMPLYLTSAQIISLDAAVGLDAARLGFGTAVYFGLAAIVAQPVAAIVGRVGAQRGMRIGAVLSMLGSLVAATARSWPTFLVAVGCAGLANAFMQVSTNIVLAVDAAFHRQGMSFGAKQGAVPLASAAAGALVPSVGVALGWRLPYVFAVWLAFTVIFLAPRVEDQSAKRKPIHDRTKPLSTALMFLAAGGACGGAAGNAAALFLVPAAVDIGTSEAGAGAILAVGSALVFVLRVAVGASADRAGSTGHLEMIIILLTGAAASFGLAFTTSPATFTMVMPLALLGSWGWPGLIYFTVVRMHPEATARASGVILSSNLTGTLIGPLIVSQLVDRGSFFAVWLLVAALSSASAAFVAASRWSWRRLQLAPAAPNDNKV